MIRGTDFIIERKSTEATSNFYRCEYLVSVTLLGCILRRS